MDMRRTGENLSSPALEIPRPRFDNGPSVFRSMAETAINAQASSPKLIHKPKRPRIIFGERGGKVVGVECPAGRKKRKEGNIILVTGEFAKAEVKAETS